MRKLRFSLSILATITFVLALAATTQAQIRQRTFVSSRGLDTNDCSEIAPCRNWQRAIDLAKPGGEVVAQDSTGFGPINITKSITITGEGVHAVARAPLAGGTTVMINAPGATVVLRHLYVENNTDVTGGRGIFVNEVSIIHIEHCVVTGFTNFAGIFLDTSCLTQMFISDTILRNNERGLNVRPDCTAFVTVDRVRAEGNTLHGFQFQEGTIATVRDSVSSGLGGFTDNGFRVHATAEVNIENSISVNNVRGIRVQPGGVLRASNVFLSNNAWGLDCGGTFVRFGNNRIFGNFVDRTGSCTDITPGQL